MSLTRRLRRLIRSHLGALRGDSLDDPFEEELEDEDGSSRQASRDPSSTAASEGGSADVPPEVAEAYRALEVPVGSGRETVKNGYRRVMKKYHQDRYQNDPEKREVAGEVSKRLNGAYERVLEYLDASGS